MPKYVSFSVCHMKVSCVTLSDLINRVDISFESIK